MVLNYYKPQISGTKLLQISEFMAKFKNAMSADFDPDTKLAKVGIANQTTMYKEETAGMAC